LVPAPRRSDERTRVSDTAIGGLPYPVILADDAAASIGSVISGARGGAFIICDRRVRARAVAIRRAIESAGVPVLGVMPIEAGEKAKRRTTVERIYGALLDEAADRTCTVVAIGGGTLTDVAGFAAATYLRGVAWVAVPTTILGMADAAIGGKTGIDHARGKNLIGAFWQPRAVVADLASLRTLPPPEWATGLAEAIKCAVIGDPSLLDAIERLPQKPDIASWRCVIAGAAQVKANIVARDPKDAGERAALNLGHTVGHAIEHARRFGVPHGHAVAVGLRAAGLIAQRFGWWPPADHARVLEAIQRAKLPIFAARVSPQAVMDGLRHDKKRLDGKLRFVLPVRIGEVRAGIEVDRRTVRDVIKACLTPPRADEWKR
jgi:3-dehydroquinate synthase